MVVRTSEIGCRRAHVHWGGVSPKCCVSPCPGVLGQGPTRLGERLLVPPLGRSESASPFGGRCFPPGGFTECDVAAALLDHRRLTICPADGQTRALKEFGEVPYGPGMVHSNDPLCHADILYG